MAGIDYRIVHEVPGRLRLHIPAMGQPGCEAAWLRAWMAAAAAVTEARANAPARTLVLRYSGGPAARAALLHRLGTFTPERVAGAGEDGVREAELAPIVTTLLTLAALPWLTPPLQLVLTMVNLGSKLTKGADTLLRKGIQKEVLDAVAVGLAAGSGRPYTANATDLLLSLGEYAERRTTRQSDRLLRRLLRPDPVMAAVERDGGPQHIAADAVRFGETLVIGPGETIPVDGHVLTGAARVSQSAVTGAERPLPKEPPARVIAGSVVLAGRLRVEASRVGADTTTARISRFVQAALERGSDNERRARDLAAQQAYLSLGTGLAVYGLTGQLSRLQSVFLVDYADALTLGVPVAFKSAMARAAERGVLLRGGAAIERLAAVDTLVLDESAGLTDSDLREDAASALSRLRALGIRRLVLVAADAPQQAAALAAALGVDAWHAEVAPAAKAELVAALRAEGCRVGYVGEDAAALGAADLGIAVARGADIVELGADRGADVVLLHQHPAALLVAREIAGKTMGLMRSNCAAAATMDTAILGGAVLGWLSPVASAFVHNGTTIATLLHARKGVAVDDAPRRPVTHQLAEPSDVLER
ncbi:hypothetical protein CKO31_06615 [Thiohalocapsa halophila]|uniref:P-type ATPase A domain-containing protein n=1 Tax=Thiohalocapsa halophila TaxID=69359 RepID=A0ABS1CET4_9GAMM|nr:HAD family hydrolase [Thiohalocapsa halophila]MBK1630422.1 hypothetical protein [Thiohalocapsa halophila]